MFLHVTSFSDRCKLSLSSICVCSSALLPIQDQLTCVSESVSRDKCREHRMVLSDLFSNSSVNDAKLYTLSVLVLSVVN